MKRSASRIRIPAVLTAPVLTSWLCLAQTPVPLAYDHAKVSNSNPSVAVTGPTKSGNGFTFSAAGTAVTVTMPSSFTSSTVQNGSVLLLTPRPVVQASLPSNVAGPNLFISGQEGGGFTDACFFNRVTPSGSCTLGGLQIVNEGGASYAVVAAQLNLISPAATIEVDALFTYQGPASSQGSFTIDHATVKGGSANNNCPASASAPNISGGEVSFAIFPSTCNKGTVSGSAILTLPATLEGSFSANSSFCDFFCFVPSNPVVSVASETVTTTVCPPTELIGCNPEATVSLSGLGQGLTGCQVDVTAKAPSSTATATTNNCTLALLDATNPAAGPQQAIVHVVFTAIEPAASIKISFQLDVYYSPGTTAQAGFKVDHVEAIQVVQNATDDEVPFIAHKETLVRVFVVSTSNQNVQVGGELNGNIIRFTNAPPTPASRSGDELAPGILDFTIDNPPLGVMNLPIHLFSVGGVATVDVNTSLNFIEPAKAPTDFYVGYLTFCVVTDGQSACPDSSIEDSPAVSRTATLEFPFPEGTIHYFPLPVGPIVLVNEGHPAFDAKITHILYKYFVWLNVFNVQLGGILLDAPRLDHVIGFTPELTLPPVAGGGLVTYENLAETGGFSPRVSWGPANGAFLAHRLGHQFGLKDHAGPTGEIGYLPLDHINLIEPAGRENLMSPGSWNTPVLAANNHPSAPIIMPADYNTLITNPAVVVAAAVAGPVGRSGISSAVRPHAATTDYVIVSGTVQRDGSSAQIDPVYHVSSALPQTPSNPNGNHCLQFRNGSSPLGQYCFDLNVSPTGVDGLDQQIFAVAAPWPAGTTQVNLVRAGSTLATITAAAQDPVVTILSPNTGAQLNGSTTISWSVSGASGAVASTLLYSSDGGTSWLPIATDIADMQYNFDASQILGGSQVLLRVIAASGLNSATATIGPMNVPQTPKIGAALPTLDFGNAVVGLPVSQSVDVTSSGSGPLTISSMTVDNPAFTVTSSTPAGSLQPGHKLTITVSLTATGSGSQTGTLTIKSNDPATPSFAVGLAGAAFASVQPSIATIQLPVDFGNVPMGQTGEMPLPLVNSNGAPLNITSIKSSDPQFVVSGPAAPLSITGEQDITLQFTPNAMGQRNATITVTSNDPTHGSLTVQVTGTGTAPNPLAPQVKSGNVVNGASFQQTVAPGAWAAILGSNFTTGSTTELAATLPLPLTLAGVSVTVAGIPAPLYFVSSNQINFQVPFEAVPGTSAPVVVTANGVASPSVLVPIAPYAVGLFTYPRTPASFDPIIVHVSTNQLVTPSDPAQANEFLVAYGTGVGHLVNPPLTGFAAGSAPLSTAVDMPTATLGGAPVTVLFAGLTPGLLGTAQFNLQLPATLPAGGSLPLVLQFPNNSSVPVNLAVNGGGTGGPAPKLGLSTTVLSFGSVTVGQTKDLSVTVSNTGNAALIVTSASLSGAGFTLTSPSSFTVAAGASLAVSVRFTPTGSAAASGSLTISSNDSTQPSASVSLSGTGAAAVPAISVSLRSLDFGTVTTGQTSVARTITINNTGASSLKVNLSTSTPFAVSPATLTIAANGTGTASVTFAPTAAGPSAGNMNITITGQSTPAASVNLTGTGTAPATGGSGNIISLKVESGTYNTSASTFSNAGGFTWDTDNTTSNWVIGVSLPGAANPLLNSPGKALTNSNLVPGSYYTYYTPPVTSWASDIRVSVGWSNGVTDVGIFQVAAFNNNTVWPYVAGATNIAVTHENVPGATYKVFQTLPQAGGAANEVLQLAITGGSGSSTENIIVSPQSLDFGTVPAGQTSSSKVISIINSSSSVATVNLTTSLPFITSPGSLTISGNTSATASVKFAPMTAAAYTGVVNITVSGQSTPAALANLSGTGTVAAAVIVSDSFNRPNATACALGQADLTLGGSGGHFYLPIFPGISGPIGASIVSGALQNNGLDFGGVQLTTAAGACANSSITGETLPQDLNIRVDLLVPKTGTNITTAGPYFRSRAAPAGDGILGGSSAGYWVQLVSTGEVRVQQLNAISTIATTGPAASFDSTVVHTLQLAAQGANLKVSLDGKALTFTQAATTSMTVSIPATGGSNNGAVGIAFGSADNRGLAGGQRASNFLISFYNPLGQF